METAEGQFLLHALRLWGVDAEFGIDPYNEYGTGTPSGQEMLNLLLDTRIAMAAGVDPSPFIHRNTYGVEAQYEVAGCGIAHHDQYLKVMGELGLPSNTPVILEDGSASSLKELVTTSLYKFRIEQELEFTAVAYSRWLPPARTWTSESNIVHSFDELAVNLLKRNPADTACDGIHGLYALVNILRANELHNILSPEVEGEVTNHLREISRTLENIQDANGLWTSGWYLKTKADSKSPYEFQAISATGHHLEWIALAPSSVRPNRFVIKKAARALCLLLEQQPLKNVSNTYPPFSHAARALCLLENLQPGQLLKTK